MGKIVNTDNYVATIQWNLCLENFQVLLLMKFLVLQNRVTSDQDIPSDEMD